jgi:hypothetical protein
VRSLFSGLSLSHLPCAEVGRVVRSPSGAPASLLLV